MTTETKVYIKKPVFRRLYVMHTTTLAEVATQNYLDANALLILNPEITSVNEPISHLMLTLPNRINFNEQDWKKKDKNGAVFAIVKDPLRPISQSIRPKISELFRLFVDFDHQTHVYLKEIEKAFKAKKAWPLQKGCEIITHIDCWDELFKPADLLPVNSCSSYLSYRNGAYDLFTESLRKMGMFVRDMTYLFHYCYNRTSIKVLDSSRAKPALQFADKFCSLLLERINEYLFILMHFYQNANGSYQDVVNYFRAHEFVEATFGEMLTWFSKKGSISHFTKYPDNFFIYDSRTLSAYKPFTDGVDGELFNDEYIFDFSHDYSSFGSDDKIREIAEKLDDNVRNFNRESFAGVQGIFGRSQSLYLHHSVSEVQSFITESEPLLEEYKNKGLWAEQLIMENELSRLRSSASRELDNLLTLPGAIDDLSLNRLVQRATTAAYAYFFGMSIHLIILEVQNQMDFVERFYKNVDELGEDFRRHIDTLLEIIDKNSLTPDEASKQLEALFKELGPFQREALRIINSHQLLNAVVRSLLVMVSACLFAWGAGIIAGSFLVGFGLSSTIVTMGTFSTQVIAFTLSAKLAESLIGGKVVFFDSMGDFFKTLGTTALMFLWFHAVGAIVKAMMSVHLSTSILVARYMSHCITMMAATTPVFAYQLHQRGQLSNKDEWVQFLIVQSILSAIFSGLLTAVQGSMMQVEAQARLESKVWGINARYRWEQVQFTMRRAAIHQKIKTAFEEWNKIDEMYRSLFELNETTAKQMRDAKLSVLNKSQGVLKGLKSLNRDLRIFRKNVLVKRDHTMDISPENEVEAMEFLLRQAESRIQATNYMSNQNQTMAGSVHEALPQFQIDNAINGLAPLGKSGCYYNCQRIFKTIQKAPELKELEFKGMPLRIVDVPAESVFRNLPERYREGILRVQGKWEIEGKTGVSEITIFDLNGKGVVPKEFFQERYKVEPVKEEITENSVAFVKKGFDTYIEYSNKEPEEIVQLLCDQPTELIWSQAELAELTQQLQKIGLEGLKERGLKKLTVLRIQEHNFGLTNRPAVFVGDPFYFEGIDNPVSAKEAIGYGKKATDEYENNTVLIWQADINDLVESNWTNARKVFDEYVRWGKEWYDYSGMDIYRPPEHFLEAYEGNPVGLEQGLKGLKEFMKTAKKFGFLNEDFTSKLSSSQWENAWEARKTVVPEEGVFGRMLDEVRTKIDPEDYAIEKPDLGLGLLMQEIGFFDLFSGDGRCRSYSGKQGVKEWLLLRNKPDSFKFVNLNKLTKEAIEKIFKFEGK